MMTLNEFAAAWGSTAQEDAVNKCMTGVYRYEQQIDRRLTEEEFLQFCTVFWKEFEI